MVKLIIWHYLTGDNEGRTRTPSFQKCWEIIKQRYLGYRRLRRRGFEKEGGELRSKGNEEVERKKDLLGCSVFCCRRRGSMQSFRPERWRWVSEFFQLQTVTWKVSVCWRQLHSGSRTSAVRVKTVASVNWEDSNQKELLPFQEKYGGDKCKNLKVHCWRRQRRCMAPPERIQASKAGGGCSQIFLSNISMIKRLNIREKGVWLLSGIRSRSNNSAKLSLQGYNYDDVKHIITSISKLFKHEV